MNLHQNRGTWISSIAYFALLFPDAIFTTKQNYIRGRCFWSFAAKQFYFRVLIVESLCFRNLMGLFSVSFYLVFVVSIFSFSFFVVDLREFIFNHTLRERSFVSSKIEYLNTEEVAISSIAFPCRWNISKLIKCFFFFFFVLIIEKYWNQRRSVSQIVVTCAIKTFLTEQSLKVSCNISCQDCKLNYHVSEERRDQNNTGCIDSVER